MVDAVCEDGLVRLGVKRSRHTSNQPLGMGNLVLAPHGGGRLATSRVPHRHELRAKVFKSHPVLSDPAGRKVLALVEALEVSSAGIDREAVGAETVRRDVEAICVGRQVDEGCFITALVLDALKRLPQMALQRHTTDDHLAHQFLGASCGKDLGRCRRQFDDFVKACGKPAVTVREVLTPVLQVGLFESDKRLLTAFNDPNPPPPAPKSRQSEAIENRLARGWHGLLESPWIQLRQFKTYLSGKSHLATHQVVKGSEFDHVMVVMDDDDAAGNLFAYDRLFGAPLGDSDLKNVEEGKETSIDRTLRLLYVTCSRAKESLALVLWAKDAGQALTYAQKSKWFKPGDVQAIPD